MPDKKPKEPAKPARPETKPDQDRHDFSKGEALPTVDADIPMPTVKPTRGKKPTAPKKADGEGGND